MKIEVCPVCGQDYIYHVLIVPLNRMPAWVCPECEAFWISEKHEYTAPRETYPAYMERHGLNGTWEELEIVFPQADDFAPEKNNSE